MGQAAAVDLVAAIETACEPAVVATPAVKALEETAQRFEQVAADTARPAE